MVGLGTLCNDYKVDSLVCSLFTDCFSCIIHIQHYYSTFKTFWYDHILPKIVDHCTSNRMTEFDNTSPDPNAHMLFCIMKYSCLPRLLLRAYTSLACLRCRHQLCDFSENNKRKNATRWQNVCKGYWSWSVAYSHFEIMRPLNERFYLLFIEILLIWCSFRGCYGKCW